MAKKELIRYIKQVKRIGHKDSAIKDHLLKHGYPETVVDDAFDSLNKRYDVAFYVMIAFIVLLVLLLAYYLVSTMLAAASDGTSIACGNTTLVVRKYQDEEVICSKIDDNLKVSFLLFNEGYADIDSVQFEYVGSLKTEKDVDLTEDLIPGSGYIKAYDHSEIEYGELQKIVATPTSQGRLCTGRAIVVTDFSPCFG